MHVDSGGSSSASLAITAGAGVLGALIGGATSGAFALAGERKRQEAAEAAERRNREQQAAQRRLEIQSAARLVHEDLDHARATISVLLDRDEGLGTRWGVVSVPTESWRQHRALLATVLSREEWAKVANSFAFIDVGFVDAELDGLHGYTSDDEVHRELEHVLAAQAALQPHLGS